MKFFNKYKKNVRKYLNWLEFQIPEFRAFCKTGWRRLPRKRFTCVALFFFNVKNLLLQPLFVGRVADDLILQGKIENEYAKYQVEHLRLHNYYQVPMQYAKL